jgi:hypothetical protein
MIYADHKAVALFVLEATARLRWMDRELAGPRSESERLALAGAREELVRMMARVANKYPAVSMTKTHQPRAGNGQAHQ